MKWLYVQKGAKNKQIIFVACHDSGKPIRSFKDMNLASMFESSNDFTNSIIDFNIASKKRLESIFKGIEIEDTGPIISVSDFGKIQKEHETSLKI